MRKTWQPLCRKREIRPAQAIAQEGLKSNPHDADLLTAYGNALLAGNQPAEVEVSYRRSLAEHPDNASALYNLADSLRRPRLDDREHFFDGSDRAVRTKKMTDLPTIENSLLPR